MENTKSGILDSTTKQVMVLSDDKVTLRSNVKVYGTLEAGLIRATELIADQRYEKQFLEFANPDGVVGSGLLWSRADGNRQFVLRNGPDRFWSTESIDIPQKQSYMIGGQVALASNYLGNSIVASNLQSLGNLKSLTVNGSANIADKFFFNEKSGRLGLGTENPNAIFAVYEPIHDVELVMDTTDTGAGKIGTHNTRALEIVTDNQTRICVDASGTVTVGHETRNTTMRVYGKLSVGVKNPQESLEVSGNIRWSNRLFTSANGAPDSGSYHKGDIVWNSDPKPNTYVGWICVAAGAPGKWHPFGLIGI
jgi:hypothetical protein